MTIGQKIKEARKAKGVRGETLGAVIGITKTTISKIENDQLKGGPDPELLVKIADALGDQSILVYALLHNPICQRIIPRAFAPLNNIKTDPSAILTKLQEELQASVMAAKKLARVFSHAEPATTPNYSEVLMANLEQIVDVTRCVEEMFGRLKECGAITEEQHLEVYVRQQAKVEANGHHKAMKEVA
jgi:transcriptional regulator with XRE-family HTH domain